MGLPRSAKLRRRLRSDCPVRPSRRSTPAQVANSPGGVTRGGEHIRKAIAIDVREERFSKKLVEARVIRFGPDGMMPPEDGAILAGDGDEIWLAVDFQEEVVVAIPIQVRTAARHMADILPA
jgi:hypothetical protein